MLLQSICVKLWVAVIFYLQLPSHLSNNRSISSYHHICQTIAVSPVTITFVKPSSGYLKIVYLHFWPDLSKEFTYKCKCWYDPTQSLFALSLLRYHHRNANQSSATVTLTKNKQKIKIYIHNCFLVVLPLFACTPIPLCHFLSLILGTPLPHLSRWRHYNGPFIILVIISFKSNVRTEIIYC